jgi:glutathione synthase/RimK-type ligase-like ATP-grasp enzyme
LPKTNSADDQFAVAEERRFAKWLIEMQHESLAIRWINSPPSALSAENKFLQLKMARSLGIAVPRTLVTTEPDRFRAFVESEEVLVAKPLTAYSWEYLSGESVAAFAAVLDTRRARELSDQDIALCVTMYQQCIAKVADVRMVIMGEDLFAYKVIQNGEQHFDYRIGFFKRDHLRFEEIPVPAPLKKRIIDFMASMKINFASADFALTADGEFVFLDLNPNGQWLFIELGCPEAGVGQKFCSFFVKGRVDAATANLFPSYSEYRQSDAAREMEESFRQHTASHAGPGNSWKEGRA